MEFGFFEVSEFGQRVISNIDRVRGL